MFEVLSKDERHKNDRTATIRGEGRRYKRAINLILIIRSVQSFEEPYAKRNKAQNSIFVPTPP